MEIYLDNSATTRPYDEVIDLMGELMREGYGNPSSLHRKGLAAETVLTTARQQVAASLGCSPAEILFTSGGTEGDNMAIRSGAMKNKRVGRRIVTTAVEHPAVLETFKMLERQGWESVIVPVTTAGVVDMEQLAAAVTDDTALLSVMQVNNETGAIMPIDEIAKLKKNALFHVDMVQSFGKLDSDLTGVDMATISGHKIHGPKGVGALYICKGLTLEPLLYGGGQEKGLRSGTENLPGLAGLGLAAEKIYEDRQAKNARLRGIKEVMRRRFMEAFGEQSTSDTRGAGRGGKSHGILFNSPEEGGAPHILSVCFEGTRGEVLLHTLEQADIYVSTGSACSSNKKGKSHVIAAMGRTDKQVEGTLRFSLSDFTTMEEAEQACDKTIEAVERFRKLGSFR